MGNQQDTAKIEEDGYDQPISPTEADHQARRYGYRLDFVGPSELEGFLDRFLAAFLPIDGKDQAAYLADGRTENRALSRGVEMCRRMFIENLRTMPYKDYLQTDHWKEVRERAVKAARHRCQLCNRGGRLEVHHRTYERRGCELPSDVIALCDVCHGKFHARIGNSGGSDSGGFGRLRGRTTS